MIWLFYVYMIHTLRKEKETKTEVPPVELDHLPTQYSFHPKDQHKS